VESGRVPASLMSPAYARLSQAPTAVVVRAIP